MNSIKAILLLALVLCNGVLLHASGPLVASPASLARSDQRRLSFADRTSSSYVADDDNTGDDDDDDDDDGSSSSSSSSSVANDDVITNDNDDTASLQPSYEDIESANATGSGNWWNYSAKDGQAIQEEDEARAKEASNQGHNFFDHPDAWPVYISVGFTVLAVTLCAVTCAKVCHQRRASYHQIPDSVKV